jgi:hypothetical protein
MSSSMYWRPVPKDLPRPELLSYDLKHRLARRFWDHDGSLNGEPIEFDATQIPYLEGLADGGVEDAQELIDAIREHGSVHVWIAN